MSAGVAYISRGIMCCVAIALVCSSFWVARSSTQTTTINSVKLSAAAAASARGGGAPIPFTSASADPTTGPFDDDEECEIHRRDNMTHSGFCSYLLSNDECVGDGIIPYLYGIYCGPLPTPLLVILYILWLVVLFFLLGAAADDFLCPSLTHISETMRVPPDVAGLTFMALGNGAPDVFGTFVAVRSYKYGISIGELLGAGLFVTTVVVGIVALTSVAKLQRMAFLRDGACYLFGLILFLGFLSDGQVTLVESVLMLVFYIGYVVFAAILSLCMRRRERNRARQLEEETSGLLADIDDDSYETHRQSLLVHGGSSDEEVESLLINAIPDDDEDEDEDLTWLQEIRAEWHRRNLPRKIMWILSSIFIIPLRISVPNVEDGEWNRYLTAVNFLVSPSLLTFAFGVSDKMLGGQFPVAVIPVFVGILAGLCILFTTRDDDFPRWKFLISIWCFVISIVWIYILANELVDMLNTFGLVLNISEVILGATVLAWGASVGDLVANVVMAKQGFPEMAIAAAYGGPLFNMMFGSSIALISVTVATYPVNYPTPIRLDTMVSGAFLVISLLVTLIVVHFQKYTVSRRFAVVFLIPIYVLYDVILVLIGAKVIDNFPITN